MEDTTGAAGSSSLPPEITMPPSPQRGQKRGAPDEDGAACDGAARGSPRRAGVETLAEEYYYMEFVHDEEDELGEAFDDDAPPARPLFEFLRVHPGGGAADAGGAAAGQEEPVDVTLRLGVGPVEGDYSGETVDTTLSLVLDFTEEPGEDDGGAALGAASSNAEFDEGPVLELNHMPAALFHEPLSAEDEEEGFFPAYDFTMASFAGTAGDGAADRPSSVLDLNQPCPSDSELPDGAPDPSGVPAPDTAAVDDDDLAAHVDERGVATATAVEQHRRSSTPFVFFSSPVHDIRAPVVLTADSS